MPAETFSCPYCHALLKKNDAAYLLGEMEQGVFLTSGPMPEKTTCTGCGGAIDTKKMISGEYDIRSLSQFPLGAKIFLALGFAAVSAFIAFMVWYNVANPPGASAAPAASARANSGH